jgi:hypothetical protein
MDDAEREVRIFLRQLLDHQCRVREECPSCADLERIMAAVSGMVFAEAPFPEYGIAARAAAKHS